MKRPTSSLLALIALLTLLAVQGDVLAEVKREMPAGVKEILDKAKQVELYSLEPEPSKEQLNGQPKLLHGWVILGQTTIKDANTRESLLKSILKTKGPSAKCFDPRHAIRATHGGKTIDLLICFECGWVYIYEADKHTATLRLGRRSQTIQPSFDKVLKEAKVPLAKKEKGD